MSDRRHGTRAKYVWDKCRCFACRVANTDYQTGREDRCRELQPWRIHHAGMTRTYCVRHTGTGEIALRTADREEAFAERDRLNREVAAQTSQQPLWAGRALLARAREHIARLQRAGMGINAIAATTNLSRNRLMEIADGAGHRGCRPARLHVKAETARRILNVQYRPANGARVPAVEAHRIIEELLAAGLRKREIAAKLGSDAKTPALQIKAKTVLRSTLLRIVDLHERIYPVMPELRRVCRCAELTEDQKRARDRAAKALSSRALPTVEEQTAYALQSRNPRPQGDRT